MNYAALGKNALLYSLSTMTLRTASFLLIPIYTYSLPIADYGLLSVLLQTAQILVIVVSVGSRTALVRFAKESEDRGDIGALIGSSIFVNVIAAVAVTVVCGLFLRPLFKEILHTGDVSRYVLWTCAAAAANCLTFHLMAYYRAGHKGFRVTAATAAAAAALLVATLFFVRIMRWGIVGALLAQTLIYGLLAAFLLLHIAATVKLGVSLRLTWRLVRFGLPLILVMGGGLITQTSALYFLSHFKGLEEAGIYSLGLKLAAIVEMVLILPFEMAYEPFVYGQIGHPALWNAISRLLTYLTAAFTLLASGIGLIARDLLPLIAPPAFSPAYLITFLALPAFAFRGVYYVGESLLFLEQRTDIAGTAVTAFGLLSVLLNYLLISRWGMYGASLVFIFTTVGTGVTVMRIGLRMAPVRIEWDRLCGAALLLFGFLTAVYSLRGGSALVYYSAAPVLMCLGALALFAAGFIREDEKRAMRNVLRRMQRVGTVLDV